FASLVSLATRPLVFTEAYVLRIGAVATGLNGAGQAARGTGGLGARGTVPGEVRRRVRGLLHGDEGPAGVGVGLVRVGEVAAHDGQLGGTVGGQRTVLLGRRELALLGGQQSRIGGVADQVLGQGRHLPAEAGGGVVDHVVDQAQPERRGGSDRQA